MVRGGSESGNWRLSGFPSTGRPFSPDRYTQTGSQQRKEKPRRRLIWRVNITRRLQLANLQGWRSVPVIDLLERAAHEGVPLAVRQAIGDAERLYSLRICQ